MLHNLRRLLSSGQQRSRLRKQARQRRRAAFARDVARPVLLETLEERRLLASTPQLLGDFGLDSRHVEHIVDVGSTTFFVASRPETGMELWKTDGTPEGTVLVKDIDPGVSGSDPRELVNVGGTLFFRAFDDDDHGIELWKSDGTEAGTVMVRDIRPGSISSFPSQLTNFGGVLFFEANDGVNGRELWKSDGTEEGTELVHDANPDASDSSPDNLTVSGGKLYFRATGSTGREIWISDGTDAGTSLLKDIRPSGNSNPNSFTDVNGTLFFQANDGGTGDELWKSDGTPEGTEIVKDIIDGPVGANPSSLTNFGGTLYFAVNDGTNGRELWKSDGTDQGTAIFKDINPGSDDSDPGGMFVMDSMLFFNASDGTNGKELWKSDGSELGTVLLKDINVGSGSSYAFGGTQVGQEVFFQAYDPTLGFELWKTDGTSFGTVLVRDIQAGPSSSYPGSLTNVGGKLLFSAIGDGGVALFQSDGTEAGTSALALFSSDADSYPENFTEVGGTAFFKAAAERSFGYELWKSDGTSAGTVIVKDIMPGLFNGSYPRGLTNLNGTLFFQATDDIYGTELWKSDGTEAGTVLVKDIAANDGSSPYYLTNVNGVLYFSAWDQANGYELWKSDGTSDGTVLVKDIYPDSYSSVPLNLSNVNGVLYFVADNGSDGNELWKSDGTEEGTVLVKDINPGPAESNPYALTVIGDTLFFTVDDGTNGYELWKSDGTSDGTVIVKDINPGANSSDPIFLRRVGNDLFFFAEDGVHGYELWKSDGTSDGTVLIKDINPGPDSSVSYSSIEFDGKLLFAATDGTSGDELWISDGTELGTVLLKDIQLGSGSSEPFYLTEVDGTVFFSAADSVHGQELWQTDGTEEGTFVHDVVPGSHGLDPRELAAVNGRLFFNGTDGVTGFEPWVIIAPDNVFLPAGGGSSTVGVEGNDLTIRDADGNIVFQEPLTDVFELIIHGSDNVDDTLTFDFANGNPIPAGGITFEGGIGGFDELNLIDPDADQDATTIRYRAVNASDGFVDIDIDGSGGFESLITYTGLEPINDNLDVANRIFQFTDAAAGGELIVLSDDAGSVAGMSQLSSTASELVVFTNPSESLTIETSSGGGSGADQINVEGLDPEFAASLAIFADSDDAVIFQTQDTDTGGGLLMVVANEIQVDAAVRSGGGSITLNAGGDLTISATGSLDTEFGGSPLTLIADIDVAGGGSVIMSDGASINARDGDLEITATDNIVLGIITTTAEARITSTSGGISSAIAVGTPNILAGRAALRALTGIQIGTQVSTIAASNDSNGLDIQNTLPAGGLLSVGTVDGLVGITNTMGSVTVENRSEANFPTPLLIDSDVLAGGDITLIAADSAQAGASDNLTVDAGVTVTSTDGTISLTAGDDMTISTGASIIASGLGGALTIRLDQTLTDPDGGPDVTGATLNLLGTVTTTGDTIIFSGDDADEFVISPEAGSSDSMVVVAGSGDDHYVIHLGSLGGTIGLADDVGGGNDALTIQGTGGDDEISVSDSETSTPFETITYSANLESLEVLAGSGNDVISVSPSTVLGIDVFGGEPDSGLGDRLAFDTPIGETSTHVSTGPDSGSITTTGGFQTVNFDEIELSNSLNLSFVSSSISEDGSTMAFVTRMDSVGELTVNLLSDDTNVATVVATVTIADGETTSEAFAIDAVDNDVLDGPRTVLISATADGFVGSSQTLQVTDLETLTLVIDAASIAENAGNAATTATVTRGNSDIGQELEVTLTNGDDSEIDIPVTVTIPANEQSVTFDIAALDDDVLDGNQTVTITASATGYVSGNDSLDVTDHETLILVIAADSIAENAGIGATTATVTRFNTDIDQELEVMLLNTDDTEVEVPLTVTIPANESSVTFDVTALDDTLLDGTQSVTLAAVNAAYFQLTNDSVNVTDHETLTVVIVADSIAENAGSTATTATVTRGNTDISQEVEVTLTNSDNTEIIIPVTASIPANEQSVTFDIAALDDTFLDGTHTVTITASAAGYVSGNDSLDVTDVETLTLVVVAASIAENAGSTATTATVTRGNTDIDQELAVTLINGDDTEIDIPLTVTIPAGETSVAFDIGALDDALLDGTQTVTITASATGYVSSNDALDVTDVETLTLLIAAASIAENAGNAATTATVTRGNTDIDQELEVTLANGDDSEIGIPVTVTIPANESSVTFDINALDDALLDGTQTVTITASATGYVSADDSLDVTDHEQTLTLVIDAVGSIAENAGTAATTATVTRVNSDTTQELEVTLTNGDDSEIDIPVTVTIPANEESVTFDIAALDDTLLDGTQTVTITASAAGFFSGNDSLDVSDHETLTLVIDAVSIAENAGSAATTATVTRSNTDIAQELEVTLINSDNSEIDIPVTVTIPAGEQSVTFDIAALDDELLDGAQTVTITASATGYISGNDSLDVTDVETLTVVIGADSIVENAGNAATTATVTRSNTDIAQELEVTLINGDDSEIEIPVTVTIPAGETSVTFDIAALDDALLDGTQSVTITASATGFVSGNDSLDVTDVETLTVVINADSIAENAGVAATTATVTRSNTDIDLQLDIALTNGDNSEIDIPLTVTIPAGETSVTFDISALDDDLLDGTQSVSITASAIGYVSGDDSLDVTDHETLFVVIDADSIAENAGNAATTATVTRSNTDFTQELEVTLTNSDDSEINIPLTVTIPADQVSVTFDIGVLDDTLLDGTQTVTITASAAGYASGNDSLDIADHETLTVVIDAVSIAENAGNAATTATVTRGNTDITQELEVTLTSSDDSEAGIPVTVTIPANETSVTFDIAALDDTLLDGTQVVTITASATGYVSGNDSLDVTDHETLIVVIDADSIAENEGTASATATVTRSNTDFTQELVVTLTNSDDSEIGIPLTVTIPADQASATFNIDALDDTILDGTQTVIITASGTGYVSGNDSLDVTDHETLTLVIATASIAENAGNAATTATVTRSNTDITQNLEVTLTNGDDSEIGIPVTVTIPANETSATFDIDALDDALMDGTQTVTITAAAAGYVSGDDSLDVTDHEQILTVVIIAASIAENAGDAATTATVTRSNADITQELEVTLTNGDDSEIGIPLTVTIPANEESVTFDIDALDDTLLDGTQTVTVTVSATGFFSGNDSLDVTDHETLTVVIDVASIAENAGSAAAIATVTRGNTDITQELEVTLTNGDDSEIGIPATVTVPAGAPSVTFEIAAVDDALLDAAQTVTITVSAAGYVAGNDSLDVTDHETLTVVIAAASISENAGSAATTATVTRGNTDISQELEVTLTNSDASEIGIPLTVTIPAGEPSVSFDISAVDDALLDGTQSVTITATATGYIAGNDSLEVTDLETLTMVIAAASIAENAGSAATTVTVSRGSTDLDQDLEVTLTNSDASEIGIPLTVTIPANQASVTFDISGIDDTILDGTQTVTITASAAGFVSANDSLDVTDHETLTIVIDAASIAENAGSAATTATVTRGNTDITEELEVTLTSSDAGEIGIPLTVTIPADQVSVTFDISGIDDTILDGTQTVTITAAATGYISVNDSLDVIDLETLTVVIAADSIAENAGSTATTATVTRGNTDINQELEVTLTSSDAGELGIPATVMIPAGESSATFDIAAIDDALLDGTQSVTITASATGYVSGNDSLDVTDLETLTVVIAAASIAENAGNAATTATVTRSNTDITQALDVTLTNSDSSEISVPLTVTIPAGESSVTFDISAVDDSLLDGPQTVTITASATGFSSGNDSLDVTDLEALTVAIAAASIAENAGNAATTVTVSRGNVDITQPLEVTLTNSDASEISTPLTVTIPANEPSVTFDISAVDDALVDGTQTVTITASATGYASGDDSLDVTDVETLTVSIAAASIAENAGNLATTVTVTRGDSDTTQALEVTLTNSDASEIGIPATITIPAGESSVTFDLAAVDDALLDGTQTVTITASAAGYASVNDSLDVTDHEALTVEVADSTIREGEKTTVTVRRDAGQASQGLQVTISTGNVPGIVTPATVEFDAGADSVSFELAAEFGSVDEGTRTITIAVTAPGYTTSAATLDITDNPIPWQNPVNRFDSNNDGVLAPLDALVIINELNIPTVLGEAGELPDTRSIDSTKPFYDVNGDGFGTPQDALNVINELNRTPGEGESPLVIPDRGPMNPSTTLRRTESSRAASDGQQSSVTNAVRVESTQPSPDCEHPLPSIDEMMDEDAESLLEAIASDICSQWFRPRE